MIAVIGIIAAVGMPSYLEYSAQARRKDGQTALLKTSQRMKTYFTENNAFTVNLSNIGYASPAVTPEGFYVLSVAAATVACPIATCFALQATPRGKQVGDRCGTLTLTSTGASGAAEAQCW